SGAQVRGPRRMYSGETSALSRWRIPERPFLETWSDARAYDGTVSIAQPLIAPLYGGKSAHDVLAAMSDRPEKSPYDLVREFWKVEKDDKTWRRWLHDGIIPNSAFTPKTVNVNPQSAIRNQSAARNPQSAIEGGELELSS